MTYNSTGAANWPETVDFVIVGGGQSGLVVASRLSEDPSKTVLVLEAGANRMGDPRIDTPGLMATLYNDPAYDWMHRTVPQAHANGRQIAWPRGKVLGGTSAMNFSALLYPAKSDFDNWAALGNPGWGGEDMAPYMKKFHKYQAPEPELAKRMMMDWVDADAQGYDGPVPAAFTPELGPFNEAWMKTFERLGYRTPGDPISGNKQGVFQNPLSIDLETGKRAYAASAYYNEEVAKRANLHVITDALVERLVLRAAEDGSGQVTATGVEVVDSRSGSGGGTKKHVVHAAKEVIVACGAVKTPQLLELSGIGSKEHLGRCGIDVVVENAQVGENLQEHVMASISFEIADDQVSGDVMRDANVVEAVMKVYQETHTGPLSGTPLSFAYTPLVGKDGALSRSEVEELLESHVDKSSYCSAGPARPSLEQQHQLLRSQLLDSGESSIEIMYIPLQLNGSGEGETDMTSLLSKAQEGNYVSIVAILMRPFSRGSVHVACSEAAGQPRVDPAYLSHPMDMEMLARAMLYVDEVASTEPLAGLLKAGGRRIPGGRPVGLEQAKEVVRQRMYSTFHPSGTCAMLPKESGGVVDGRLRVYGTSNVRVVDASVFPMEPLGHLQSTVYAVAERAADLIKADW